MCTTRNIVMCVSVCLFLTQWDLLPRLSWQNKDQQSQSGDQDTWEEQVNPVVEGPPPHHHRERDVRIRLLAAFVLFLVHFPIDRWQKNSPLRNVRTFESNRSTGRSFLPTRSHSPLGCSWRCLPPSSVGPESSARMTRNQIWAHIFEHRRGTSAHQCGTCS